MMGCEGVVIGREGGVLGLWVLREMLWQIGDWSQ